MDGISPWVAFTGGLVSLLSPCILPMVPVYVASLAGPDIFQKGVAGRRLSIFIHSLSFIIGFSIGKCFIDKEGKMKSRVVSAFPDKAALEKQLATIFNSP